MTDTPSAKRQRLETHADDTGEIRSKYWFDDGNVVLQAEKTQFRVHRSMLAYHSNVFKDMFSLPQPEQPSEPCVDGCPVVEMSDKAGDVEYVISIFYENIRTNDMRALMSFEHLAAILRLGKKYEIDHLRDEGLRRLRREFPMTLKLWDEAIEKDMEISRSLFCCEDIINLAHELSIHTVLPAAYTLYSANYSSENMLDYESGRTQLNQRALKGCLIGREMLFRKAHEAFKEWLNHGLDFIIPGPSCTSPENCKASKFLALDHIPAMDFSDGQMDILFELKESFTRSICLKCRRSIIAAYDKVREELWQSLPTLFGLPNWEDLRDFDA
ncbi:hypothetical protein GALMADRAFT_257849 [Galerina marginata CBS 339.88]|uniref:BTB domain-containing protein n=1 Tax=Galerina marginata (strain CBS 339.88) TaxID=685588 RepID=A0A067SLH7_GALM3|nr:hypothetical protein GALMADRAFT_257849 [Galerina marginata CBS 339.88]